MHEALNASAFRSREGRQWRRYTRARQVKWPGWKIHRPGSSPGSALPSPAYCCLIALFVLFSRWNGVGGLCFDGDNQKKVVNFSEEKSASGWPGWRIFWPRNDLAPLLRWRRHWRSTRMLQCVHQCDTSTAMVRRPISLTSILNYTARVRGWCFSWISFCVIQSTRLSAGVEPDPTQNPCSIAGTRHASI